MIPERECCGQPMTDAVRVNMLRAFLEEMADGHVSAGEWPSMPMERIVDVLRETEPDRT